MCQQTQVATVMPYYERWMARFPCAEALAGASLDQVHALWQGLGYYRRADMLQRGAQWVIEQGWPRSYSEWLHVPGVGKYTAGAIASISLGERVPAVDGNVVRVYSRLTADASPFEKAAKNAEAWAKEVIPTEHCGDWNQALMELGALICRPKNPRCTECPISAHCKAAKQNRQGELPVAKVVPELKRVEMQVVVPVCGDNFGLTQSRQVRWWRGLWTFPESIPAEWVESTLELPAVRHTVTNHRITLCPTIAVVRHPIPEVTWFAPDAMQEIGIPAPHRKIFELARGHLGIEPK